MILQHYIAILDLYLYMVDKNWLNEQFVIISVGTISENYCSVCHE